MWQELGGTTYSFSVLYLLKSLMSLASTALICSKVPGRPLAPVPKSNRVLALSVVVDVEPAEDSLGHSGQLVQSSAEQEREHAPQLHILRVGQPYGSIVSKKDAVLPEAAVVARVGGVTDTVCASISVR